MARKKSQPADASLPVGAQPCAADDTNVVANVVRTTGAIMLIGEPLCATLAKKAIAGACEVAIVLRTLPELLEASASCDVLVVCAQGDDVLLRDTIETLSRQRPGVSCVVWCDAPTIELASACLQLGAADLIASDAQDARERLLKAAKRTRSWRTKRRSQAGKARELRETSKQLATLQDELEKQVGAVAGQLAGSFRDVAVQLKYVAIATELETLLRQELEVEALLRTTLEFLLRKVGAVNAAIFMPDDGGDYSLGAYVNYDFPRDSAQSTLEELGNTLAPMFDARNGLHVVPDAGALPPREDELLGNVGGPAMGWLRDATLAVFSCQGKIKSAGSGADQCSAMIAIFRDKRTQFDGQSLRLLTIIGEHFGQQMARLVATTNRAAKHNWDASGDARGEAA